MKTWMLTLFLALFSLVGACNSAVAQEYPVKGRTLTLIVPFPPGGGTDILARMLAQKLSEQWGVTSIVENKPGGDMLIGSQAIANAKKDGYTIGLTTIGFLLNGVVMAKQPVDLKRDFAPIGMIGRSAHVLAVGANSPYKTYKDLEDAAKANPNKMSYGSCCTGMYFAAEMLKSVTNLRGLHVPYKGSAPAVNAMLAGEITFIIDTQTVIKPFVESGKFRALLVTARTRVPAMPDVPTLADVGVPGNFETEVWWGLVFPAGVSPEIVNKANQTLNKIIDMPDVRKRMADFSIEPLSSTPAGMAKQIQMDFERYSNLAKQAKLPMAQ